MAVTRDEENVDLGSALGVLASNWWLLVLLAVLGAAVAGVVAYVQPPTYEATSVVYLGQPTDANGNAIAGVNSSSQGVTELATSASLLREAAGQVDHGLTATRLHDRLTVRTPSSASTRAGTTVSNIITFSVDDTDRRRAADSANAVADVLVKEISGYTVEKIALLKGTIADDQQRLSTADERIGQATKALTAIVAGGGSATEKAAASAPYLNIVQSAAAVRDQAVQQLQASRLALIVATGVELPRLISSAAVPDSSVRPVPVLDIAIGLLVGLVVAVVVAFARARRQRRSVG